MFPEYRYFGIGICLTTTRRIAVYHDLCFPKEVWLLNTYDDQKNQRRATDSADVNRIQPTKTTDSLISLLKKWAADRIEQLQVGSHSVRRNTHRPRNLAESS